MDREMLLKRLADAQDQVVRGERIVALQREIIIELKSGGHDTADAMRLLARFEEVLATHIANRERIAKELAESG